jgi:hypothetical protein
MIETHFIFTNFFWNVILGGFLIRRPAVPKKHNETIGKEEDQILGFFFPLDSLTFLEILWHLALSGPILFSQ